MLQLVDFFTPPKLLQVTVLSSSSFLPLSLPPFQDVCVPLSRLADCVSETKAELEKVDLPAPVLAHAGDGNFHVCIFVDPNDPQQVAEAKRLSRNITMRALAMDGTSETQTPCVANVVVCFSSAPFSTFMAFQEEFSLCVFTSPFLQAHAQESMG